MFRSDRLAFDQTTPEHITPDGVRGVRERGYYKHHTPTELRNQSDAESRHQIYYQGHRQTL